MRVVALALGSLLLVASAGCRTDGDIRAGGGRASLPADTRYRGSFVVIESPDHGPQLCAHIADSLPPECRVPAPDVVGWNWDAVEGEQSADGITWGGYQVVGTWDGERLTLTDPPGPPAAAPPGRVDLTSPCPEPTGGWAPLNSAATTRETLDAAVALARQRPDIAGAWLDQSANPALADGVVDPGDEQGLDDPKRLVLNVRVTGDVDAAQRDLRTVWGGALCVSSAEHSLEDLAAIQEEIDGSGVALSTGVNEDKGRVEVKVFVDGGLQAQYDEQYGVATVVVIPLLVPAD